MSNELKRKLVCSPKSFYNGSTKKEYLYHLQKRRQRMERERLYQSRPLPSRKEYRHCFLEQVVWEWFPRQQLALDFCVASKQSNLFVFAREKKNDGKRQYLVTTHKQFWEKYVCMKKENCHFYEVIRLSDHCRLYFDVEYNRLLNPLVDSNVVLALFIDVVCHCLQKAFGIVCTRRNVIDLDSSSTTKFSRHLIFHLGDNLFLNNIQCGYFVKDMCSLLKMFIESGTPNKFFPITGQKSNDTVDTVCQELTKDELSRLLVHSDNGKTFICDLSVYTKNRNFRLFRSCKVSKNIPLVIAKENQFIFKKELNYIERQFYKIRCEVFDPECNKFCDTLVCPGKKTDTLLCYGEDNQPHVRSFGKKDSDCCGKFVEGFESSPYPLLDEFVLEVVKKNQCPGVIRRWMFYEASHLIIYDIGNNRWCGNIQRQHKSNHVYFVADLKLQVLYQKCHDPDCSGYRSEMIPIPKKLNPCFQEEDEIEELDKSLDAELNEFFSEDFDIEGSGGFDIENIQGESAKCSTRDCVKSSVSQKGFNKNLKAFSTSNTPKDFTDEIGQDLDDFSNEILQEIDKCLIRNDQAIKTNHRDRNSIMNLEGEIGSFDNEPLEKTLDNDDQSIMTENEVAKINDMLDSKVLEEFMVDFQEDFVISL